MRKTLCILAALAILATLAIPVSQINAGDDGKKVVKKDGDDPGAFPPVEPSKSQNPSFTDDMEKLKSTCTLTEKQEAKIKELREARDKALAGWDKTNQKMIDAINAKMTSAKNDRARQPLEAQLKTLLRSRASLADQHERRMFGILTPEQRGKWNAPILHAEITKEFQPLNLTAEQDQKVVTLCEAQGKIQAAPVDPVNGASALNAIKRMVYQRILTNEQRKEYTKMKAPTKKTTKGSKVGVGG